MPVTEGNGLKMPTAEEIRALSQSVKVKSVRASDFTGWEAALKDPNKNPCRFLRVQDQGNWGACQGQALCNGAEARRWHVTGEMVQYADMYAYNMSEALMSQNQVGRDEGTSIGSGVRLLTGNHSIPGVKPGLPLESNWSYSTYERSYRSLISRATKVEIEDGFVTEFGPLPDFDNLLAALPAGATGHIGTQWPCKWGTLNGRKLMNTVPTGPGGHATEIVWAEFINGQWYLIVWNSHRDAFYYMTRQVYDKLQSRSQPFAPFGGYILMPDKPVERWHKRTLSGGGYL